MGKEKPISVRLDEAALENLNLIMEKTGMTKSAVINQMLMHGANVCVIDGRELAAELQRIRLYIAKPWLRDTDSCMLENLCSNVTDYFYKMVRRTEVLYGDFESD